MPYVRDGTLLVCLIYMAKLLSSPEPSIRIIRRSDTVLILFSSPASIGWHMAYQLASKGARVYIGARNQEKAADGIKQMKDMASNPKDLAVRPLVIDLGDFKQIVRVVKEFYTLEDRLDILINNAAVYVIDARGFH